MCPPPTRRQKKTKHFFLEVDSEQEHFIKNVHMHTPEQQIINEEQEHARHIRRNRRAIGRQLSTELLLRYQLFVERRQNAEERERHQEELAQVAHRMTEIFREIRQIEEQLRSSDTPVNIREQLRRRHEELCALLNITNIN